MMDYFGGRTDDQGRLYADAYVPDPHFYFGDFTVGASLLTQKNAIPMSGLEDYFAIFRLMAVSTGAFRAKIYFAADGKSLTTGAAGTTDRMRSEGLFGTASRPHVLPCPWIIPGKSTIYLDLEDVTGNSNAIHPIFAGVRLNLK
jgi:hypothetical protein